MILECYDRSYNIQSFPALGVPDCGRNAAFIKKIQKAFAVPLAQKKKQWMRSQGLQMAAAGGTTPKTLMALSQARPGGYPPVPPLLVALSPLQGFSHPCTPSPPAPVSLPPWSLSNHCLSTQAD